MQSFASPAENRASYPTEGQGGYGGKATYPLAGKCAGAEVDGHGPEPLVILSPVGSDVYLSTTAPIAERLV
jgi:hypothetical protein